MRFYVLLVLLLIYSEHDFAELVVVADQGNTVSATPYIQKITIPTESLINQSVRKQLGKLKGRQVVMDKLLYPNTSNFTVGKVTKHRLLSKKFTSIPVFVIGDDHYSIQWARKNAEYFKKIHAFGIITNIKSSKEARRVHRETGLIVTPVSLNNFDKIVGTSYYPFLIYQGWVVQ